MTKSGRPYRAFTAGSWWNTRVPEDVSLNADNEAILSYLSTAPESGSGCLTLAGAGGSPWGQPIYWARPTDREYDVGGMTTGRPREFERLRIPAGTRAAANSDGSLTIFDLDKGYVALLTDAAYDGENDEWSASGATVTYLRSNGLHALTGRSDDARNTGTHRGNNGATVAVRWDMVKAGVVNHVLKAASGPALANRSEFPMVGSDGDYEGTDAAVPPQGVRLRIKPSVDLKSLGLHPQALVIARALQRYGFYFGDSSGVTALKLEDTRAEGRGQLWDVTSEDLCGLPFTPDYWDVLPPGYDPSERR
ncbi:MAG: hypothetical protein H0T17_01170 [Propionibacteriales bacterium]|nr:hypothetical protein [Propionibacteriales bacterium]